MVGVWWRWQWWSMVDILQQRWCVALFLRHGFIATSMHSCQRPPSVPPCLHACSLTNASRFTNPVPLLHRAQMEYERKSLSQLSLRTSLALNDCSAGATSEQA